MLPYGLSVLFTMILVLVIAFAFTWPYAITCLLVALTVLDEYMMLLLCEALFTS